MKRALKGNEGDSDGSSDFDVKEGDNCEANEDVQEYDDDGSEDEGDGSLGETSDEEDDPHSDDVTETLEEASSGGVSRKRKLVEVSLFELYSLEFLVIIVQCGFASSVTDLNVCVFHSSNFRLKMAPHQACPRKRKKLNPHQVCRNLHLPKK